MPVALLAEVSRYDPKSVVRHGSIDEIAAAMSMNQRNVLGTELVPCSMDPLTGYYRNGCCENRGDDPGHARRVLPRDRRVPRVLRRRRQRPRHADAAVRVRRAAARATSGACARPAGPRRWRPARRARSCWRARTCRPSSTSTSTTSGPTPSTSSRSAPEQVAPAAPGRPSATCVGRHAQRRLRHRVDERAQLVVVVERRWPRPRTARRRSSTSSAGGVGSRNPQIVNAMRRSWITGARPNSDARRRAIAVHAGDGVVDALARLRVHLGSQAGGEGERVALVGALVAEPGARPAGGRSISAGRSAIHGPGTWSGDSYPRASSIGETGANFGAAMRRAP